MNYNDLVNLFHSSEAEDWKVLHLDNGSTQAFLRTDIDLRIISSDWDEHVQNNNYVEAWAQKWPNKRTVGYFYDLHYRSTLIARYVLVSVDGGRALLPAPERPDALAVSRSAFKVAEIFNGAKLYEYMEESGLQRSEVRDLL